MRFATPLVQATLVRRYKRFLSDHRLACGTIVTAHCVNPGAMMGICETGARTWLEPVSSATRKLKWTWQIVKSAETLVGCNTGLPNRIVRDAIENREIQELTGYETLRCEVRYGTGSRVDILLEDPARRSCFVEIKNCHLRRFGRLAEFPDSRTVRGARHMVELARTVEQGHRAVVVFCIQRDDCDSFAPARDIDSDYADAFERALSRGVEALAFSCKVTKHEITLHRSMPITSATGAGLEHHHV